MPPKKLTRTQLRVTAIHESDDTLQAAGSTAERTTPTVFPAAEINHDDNLYDNLGGERNKDSPIENNSGDLHSQIMKKIVQTWRLNTDCCGNAARESSQVESRTET